MPLQMVSIKHWFVIHVARTSKNKQLRNNINSESKLQWWIDWQELGNYL
jgi:hypothetical protein